MRISHFFIDRPIFAAVLSVVMVLLGGLQTLSGPLVGAAVYHALQAEVMRSTEYWRLLLGAVIILLVVAFPQGIAGAIRQAFGAKLDARGTGKRGPASLAEPGRSEGR